jgi:hypothetical protein
MFQLLMKMLIIKLTTEICYSDVVDARLSILAYCDSFIAARITMTITPTIAVA